MLLEVNSENRMILPGSVFLLLIPVFSLVYVFYVFSKITQSIRKEYEFREMTLPGDGLRTIGIILALFFELCMVFNYFDIAFTNLVSDVFLVILIVYWVQSSRIKKELRLSSTNAQVDIPD